MRSILSSICFYCTIFIICQTTGVSSSDMIQNIETHPKLKNMILTSNPPLSYAYLETQGMKEMQVEPVSFEDFSKIFPVKIGVLSGPSDESRSDIDVVLLFSTPFSLTISKYLGCFLSNTTKQLDLVCMDMSKSKSKFKSLYERLVNFWQAISSTILRSRSSIVLERSNGFILRIEHEKALNKLALKVWSEREQKIINTLDTPSNEEPLEIRLYQKVIIGREEVVDSKSNRKLPFYYFQHQIVTGSSERTYIDLSTGKLVRLFMDPDNCHNCKNYSFVKLDNHLFFVRRYEHGPKSGRTLPSAFDLESGQEITKQFNFKKISEYQIEEISFLFTDNGPETLVKVFNGFESKYLRGSGIFPKLFTSEKENIYQILHFDNNVDIRLAFRNSIPENYYVRMGNTHFNPISYRGVIKKLCEKFHPILEQFPIFVDFYITNHRDGLKIPTGLAVSQGIKRGQKVPAIIYIHGGPSLHVGTSFNEEHFLCFARSCALFIPNIRGSTGISP